MPGGAAILGDYNFAADLIERNLAARADKIAFIDADGRYSYAEVAERSARVAGALLGQGLQPQDRVLLCLSDGIDLVTGFLGAIKAGLVAVPLNTLLTAADYAFIVANSAPGAIVTSPALLPTIQEAIQMAGWSGHLVVAGAPPPAVLSLASLTDAAQPAPTHLARPEDAAFWLYSSGSTGKPKGVMHRHASPLLTARHFSQEVLGLREDDVVFSAAKVFFAYGLGNALVFPMACGATTVLLAERATPAAVCRLLAQQSVTVFCGVPTLFGTILATAEAPLKGATTLRLCTSAGEALPETIGRAWLERTGAEIVDGVGSTEMLHIYVSNRPGDIRHGASGLPVPGYEVRLVDEGGNPPAAGEIGELHVRGPSTAIGYSSNPDLTQATFADGWMKTGDKFRMGDDGVLTYCGRADDMLKVGGVWVSPSEVENALLAHESVLEAAVIGAPDDNGLIKTKAFIVARTGAAADATLAAELQSFVKGRLAPFKYPRTIEFVAELPKTATGKIRRHVLRERERAAAEQTPMGRSDVP